MKFLRAWKNNWDTYKQVINIKPIQEHIWCFFSAFEKQMLIIESFEGQFVLKNKPIGGCCIMHICLQFPDAAQQAMGMDDGYKY